MADDFKIIEIEQPDGSVKYQVEGYDKLFDSRDDAKKWAVSKLMKDATDMPDQRKGSGYRTKSEKQQSDDAKSKSGGKSSGAGKKKAK